MPRLALIALVVLIAAAPPPEPVAVARVIDGDTVVCEGADGVRFVVRLLGVDTPETVHPRKGVEPWGPEASAYVKDRLVGKAVVLVEDTVSKPADNYGRRLRWVFLAETGECLNETLVKEGYGRAYLDEYKVDPVMSVKLRLLERAAKAEGRGLWGVAPPALSAQ